MTISADQNDRRVRRLEVTPAGADLETLLTEAQMRLLDASFREVGPEVERAWRQVMAQLRAHDQ